MTHHARNEPQGEEPVIGMSPANQQAFGASVGSHESYTLGPDSLIYRAAPKPLRVFLQTGERDLDLVFGHWLLANREIAAALAYHGYDHQLVVGEGGHTLKHDGAIFPDTLRWLWRDVRRDGQGAAASP